MQPNKLFSQTCDFVAGAMTADALPPISLPEVAFAGLSNVGKSSLLNTLTKRKALARTSQTPGRTRQLNFFNLADKLLMVDLPGYGYAKASKKDISSWTNLTKKYLLGRTTLRRVFLLIDARRGLKDADEEYMKLFDESAVVYQILLTKCDKVSAAELEKVEAETLARVSKHPAAMPTILRTSAHKGDGIDSLRGEIARLAR